MKECPSERSVLDAVFSGQWPDGCDAAVRAHVTACQSCTDAVSIAWCFRAEYEDLMTHARVPPAGVVWWRATVRARLEATQSAARPITWMQGATVAALLGILAAVGMFAWPTLSDAGRRAWGYAIRASDPASEDLARIVLSMTWGSVPLAMAAAACLLLMPLIALSLARFADRRE